MAVTALRPNPRFQAFDLNGDPLAGGKLYAYSAGTTTALATYTDSTGTVANANPVILDSRGEASVWFQPLNYKLILKDEDDNTIWTQDNYSGSPYPITDEWITYVHTWTYISATQVSVPGDQTAIYTTNKAIRAVCTAGTFYGTLTNAAYDGSTKTTLTVSFESGSFDSGVAGSSKISIGVQSTESPALTYATASAASAAAAATSATAAAASAATIGTTAAFSDVNPIVKGSADTTKQVRMEVDGLTPGATRVITMPDRDGQLGLQGKGADIASAATVNLDTATGDFVHVTGTTTITALTLASGIERTVVFDGALTLTHNATSLILPGGANITTAAGDRAIFRGEGSSNVRCIDYIKASGQAVVAPSQAIALLATLTPTAAANVDALSVFTSSYDNYLVIGDGITVSPSDSLLLRFASGGVVDTGSNYINNVTTASSVSATSSFMNISGATSVHGGGRGVNFVLNITNVNDSTNRIKGVMCNALLQSAVTPAYIQSINAGVYSAANAISGMRFYWSGGNSFGATGTIRIYGHNNT